MDVCRFGYFPIIWLRRISIISFLISYVLNFRIEALILFLLLLLAGQNIFPFFPLSLVPLSIPFPFPLSPRPCLAHYHISSMALSSSPVPYPSLIPLLPLSLTPALSLIPRSLPGSISSRSLTSLKKLPSHRNRRIAG